MALPRPFIAAALLSFALAALGLTGCGAGSSESPSGSASSTSSLEAKQVADYMQQWYLWSSEMPVRDPAGFSSPSQALSELRVARDRYSFIEPATSFNAFFGAGQTVGFGIGYTVLTVTGASELLVRYTQPASNAAAGDLRRGDKITAIDGESVAVLVAENRLDAAFGAPEAGVRKTFAVLRGSTQFNLTLEKSVYTVAASFGSRIIAPPATGTSRKVGYLHLFTFTGSSQTEWLNLLASLVSQGFDDLIVDLRDNGGGLVSAANLIGSSMAGNQIGQASVRLQFNPSQSAANSQYQFVASSPQVNPTRLVWLTSERTCSAAEQLMHMLEPVRASMDTARIGTKTCGKPVGFTPPTIGQNVYNIVSFQSANRSEPASYFDGMTPTCEVVDSVTAAYGEPSDPLVAAALQWLASGTCPAVSSARGEKSDLPGRALPAMTGTGPAKRFTDLLDLR